MTASIQQMNRLRLGTRGSKLAVWQANFVAEKLKHVLPDTDIHIKTIKTRGDEILDIALSKIGDKGLFTGAIESELLEGTIDIAVHSLKDLPSKLQVGLQVGAVLKREIPLDALLSFHGYTFDTLP
jgi:hydroxymethylbilane synthase